MCSRGCVSFCTSSAVSPIKYAVLSEVDPSYLTTGKVSVGFRLTCMRADYDIVLYARDWAPVEDSWNPGTPFSDSPESVAESLAPSPHPLPKTRPPQVGGASASHRTLQPGALNSFLARFLKYVVGYVITFK